MEMVWVGYLGGLLVREKNAKLYVAVPFYDMGCLLMQSLLNAVTAGTRVSFLTRPEENEAQRDIIKRLVS